MFFSGSRVNSGVGQRNLIFLTASSGTSTYTDPSHMGNGDHLIKMASTRPTAIKSTSAGRLVLILPVKGKKVKCIGPSPLEVLIRSREHEPTWTGNRSAIAAGFRHDSDTRL